MQQVFDYANQVVIFAIFAVSLNVLLGYAGQLSVAHAAFGAVGGYLAAWLAMAHGWTLLLCLAAGTVGAGLVGALASIPALYLDVRFLILLTLALSTAILAVAGAIPALGETTGLTSLPFPTVFGHVLLLPSDFFKLAIVIGLIVVVICWRMAHSPFGRVLRGIRDDDLACKGIGKDVVTSKIVVFGVTAALAGTAGVLYTFYYSSIQPTNFNLTVSLEIIAMVVIGGSANLIGSILGATIIVLITPFLQNVVNLSPNSAGLIRLAIYGLLIVLFIMLLPGGLLPEGFKITRPVESWRRARGLPAAVGDDDLTQVEGQDSLAPAVVTAIAVGNGHSDGATAGSVATVGNGNGEVALRASGLTKHFGGIRAADELDLELRNGQVTGLIGPNGAGKTTVFNILTRVIVPDAGEVKLGDQVLGDWPTNKIATSGMSRSYQDVRIFGRMSVLDNVLIAVPHQPGEKLFNLFLRPLKVRRFEREARVKAMEHLRFVGLADQAEALAASLPFGDQKLLALARLLATESDVLLLDEPASGIDIDGVERMLGLIAQLRERGKCVCIVEHNLHVVERVADRVYFMEAGRITAEGTMADLMKQERLSEVYFGGA